MTQRDDIIALIVSKARQHDIEPYELLGGLIAEGLDPHASRPVNQVDWRRYWEPPDPRFDVSFGLGQKNVRYSDEYAAWCRSQGFEPTDPRADAYPGDDVIAAIRAAYYDPAHAIDVAAQGYRYWRFDPPVSPLQAWTAYNRPASYKAWPNVTNVEQRENYRRGLAEAQRILGVSAVPTYRPDTPIETQQHDWDCAEQSTKWGLNALGRNPSDAWLESQMLADNVESTELGLTLADGSRLATWITRQYADPSEGTPIITARNNGSVTFDDVRSVVGSTAVLIGGRNWGGPGRGHWTGVRRYDPQQGTLVLANPGGTGPVYGQQTLDRQQFTDRGPWSMVVLSADGAQPVPEPAPAQPAPSPADDPDAWVRAVAYLADDVAAIEDRSARLAEAKRVREQFVGPRPAA